MRAGSGLDARFRVDRLGGKVFRVEQTAYYLVVIALGVANVVLAAVAYAQRARQLAGRRLHESQIELAEQRNRMAAERVERLDQQVALLTAIRDRMPLNRHRSGTTGERIVGVIDVGSTTVRLVAVAADADGRYGKIGDARAFQHLGAEVERDGGYSPATLRNVAANVAALQHHARGLGCAEVAIVVTAPGRIGDNPGALVAAIEHATGSPVAALTAAQEAQLCFLGAASLACHSQQRLAVCDVGGGSTEVAIGCAGVGVEQTYCFETGALSLAE